MRPTGTSGCVWLAALLVWGCTAEPAGEPGTGLTVEVLSEGAAISGANGLRVAPDGRLYVASVIGSEIVILDPDSGEVLDRLSEGVDGPDDLAFNAAGDLYWTSILTGEVGGLTAAGGRVTAARLTPGVNPIAFSDDGRLFVSQCFFDDKLYEVDPAGQAPARLISDQLGPDCGLNGMDWGPDGRLYGPRWFRQQVVSFDVDAGDMRVEAIGFGVPAAVKFDSQGVLLHVLDTLAGAVVRVADQRQTVVAQLGPGLDNLAFDEEDRLFVSSFVDGSVWRVEDEGNVALSPAGMAHPGALAVHGEGDSALLLVADLHALRAFDPSTGEQVWMETNILGVGELGSVLAVAADGTNLLLGSFTDNNVRIWDPVRKRNLSRMDDLQMPVSEAPVVFASGLQAPTDLLTDGDLLWVSDRSAGQVLLIGRGGRPVEPVVLADGLDAPEGLALWGDRVLIREGESGVVLVLDEGAAKPLVTLGPGSPPASAAQPPAMVLNDIEVIGDTLYGTNELDRQLVKVDLGGDR
jgi:sugar lactone lactonase YvrE